MGARLAEGWSVSQCSHSQLGAEVAMQDLDAFLIRPMAAREALPGLRKALLSCCQALLIPQLKEAPACKPFILCALPDQCVCSHALDRHGCLSIGVFTPESLGSRCWPAELSMP